VKAAMDAHKNGLVSGVSCCPSGAGAMFMF
jgi:hypothetical protein